VPRSLGERGANQGRAERMDRQAGKEEAEQNRGKNRRGGTISQQEKDWDARSTLQRLRE